jgi:ATP-dependent helicase HrpB
MLPVHAIREDFLAALRNAPVVLSSPTGSGKSTEVPRWCPGRVLVIEPRRIACRSLASRVAELEQTELGDGCGYVVRDERVMRDSSRIVFATPGIVLRDRALLASARTIILDEFHERSLEIDLLLALLIDARRRDPGTAPHLVVMSATVEGERVASHLGGEHLSAGGRLYPVELRYLPEGTILPENEGLEHRIDRALQAANDEEGDVLVFLPGKAEIERCAVHLSTSRSLRPFTLVPLHGGLSLDAQRRAFASSPQRKVILATNVAETSLTIPGVRVVIDSGLVRQTRYHEGRGSLALVPIADDSATQRMGRAGRTAPGICYRLWSREARLQPTTAPEIHRESLVPLVLGAAAWDREIEALPLLDSPKPYALEAARADLAAWGALAGAALNERGRDLFSLPVDPRHARIVLAARERGCVEDAIDLVAALSITRPLFIGTETGGPDDLLRHGCDATALIGAVRARDGDAHGLCPRALSEIHETRLRLRRIEGLALTAPTPMPIERAPLVDAVIAADRRVLHVARKRGRDGAFSNGGTELSLGRGSAVGRLSTVEALIVLDIRSSGAGRTQRTWITAAMAVPMATLARAGLGEEKLTSVSVVDRRVVATIERRFAGQTIATREDVPSGALAREAIVTLLLRGSLFRDAIASTRARLERDALAAALGAQGHDGFAPREHLPPIDAWLDSRLVDLGVESGDDLALLSASDVLAPELPFEVLDPLDRQFPAEVSVGDASYRAEYDLPRRTVLLTLVRGHRREPPPRAYLPRFHGLKVLVSTPAGTSPAR